MPEYGTWKSEPASEDAWDVDWSIAEPDPEYIEREAYREMFQSDYIKAKEIKYLYNEKRVF